MFPVPAEIREVGRDEDSGKMLRVPSAAGAEGPQHGLLGFCRPLQGPTLRLPAPRLARSYLPCLGVRFGHFLPVTGTRAEDVHISAP